jgi:hypothetical protein
MRLSLFGLMLVMLTLTAWIAFAQVPKGTEHMKLEGGAQGPVPFPHSRHQAVVNDCLVCHTHFAQQEGSIARAIDEGRLTRKQVMNKQCI